MPAFKGQRELKGWQKFELFSKVLDLDTSVSDSSISNIPFVRMEFRRMKKKNTSSGNLATGFALHSVSNHDIPSFGGSDVNIITK